jgi:glycosyltransferase involved in cell wall biosynthesis/CDP-glycerol glycerophosphotransferase (TagB/SpsB family)
MWDQRRILVNARTAVNYVMVAPVHRRIAADPRVSVSFIASEEPARARTIFHDAGPDAHIVGPLRAAALRFDAYLTSDFMWTPLPRGTCRIQMFHGVGGKYGFDAPTESMRVWDRLFFVNRRRLRNWVAAGAIDPDSAAIRLIGMPKVDCLVDGSLTRDAGLASLGLDPGRKTVLYAPTWSPASSLNRMGLDLIRRLAALPVNLIVKLHDRSRDPRVRYSGGVDWAEAVQAVLPAGRGVLAPGADICPYLASADLMITDHSSAGFEYLLLDRPIVRIHVPELIASAQIHRDYVSLLADVSESATDAASAVRAVERGFATPTARSATRREVAADLFHDPGHATERCVAALYDAIKLAAPAACTLEATAGTVAPSTSSPRTLAPSILAPGTLPTVSVVMPAFNAARYIDRAINSVRGQTISDLELLVVDDGSTDDTIEVVARHGALDSRIRLFHQTNRGPGPARNVAFRAAHGRFLAFLDSDDAWAPTFLERQLSLLERRPDVDVIFGNAWCRGGPHDGQPARPTAPDERRLQLADILADDSLHFIMAVFRREVIEAVGGFDPAFLTNEEYEMWLRAGRAEFSFARNPEPLGWYTCRPDSLSSSDTRMLEGALRVLEHTRPLLPEGSAERALLDQSRARYDADLAAARVRDSLGRRDASAARIHLTALHARRGGWLLALAARLPRAAMTLYRVRQVVRGAA